MRWAVSISLSHRSCDLPESHGVATGFFVLGRIFSPWMWAMIGSDDGKVGGPERHVERLKDSGSSCTGCLRHEWIDAILVAQMS